MKCSDLIVRILEENGVEHIFGVPGDIETDFAGSLKNSPIKFITTRNEKSAAFMADIYGRIKGLGVCFSTVGPGATNLVSGIANATQDRSPVIALSDQVSTSELFLGSHQYVDFDTLFHPNTGVTKWSATLRDPNAVIELFHRAISEATTEYRGAVHIGLPTDSLVADIDYRGQSLRVSVAPLGAPVLPSGDYLETIYQKIRSGNGIIVAGPSINRTNAQIQFQRFVEQSRLSVLTTFMGKGSIDDKSPLYLGTISRHLHHIFKEIFTGVDFVLCVGFDFIEGVKPAMFGDPQKVINLDVVDNRMGGKAFRPPLNMFGDLNALFTELSRLEYRERTGIDIEDIRKKIHAAIYKDLDMNVYPPRAHRVMEAINTVYGEHSTIVCDVGLNKYYSGLLLHSTPTNRIIFSNGMSSMAFTSGALAAKLADPQNDVLAIVGDGGFLMDPQEISTCIRYNIPLTVVILNNEGLGLIEQAQRKNFGSKHEVNFASPDYVKFAESFGARGYSVRSHGQLEDILAETRGNKRVNIIEVPVDYYEGI